MKGNRLLIALVALVLALPISVAAKDKKKPAPRGIIESMQALPCGVKQKGLNGLGTLWGSVGVTNVNANEKLCPQYLLRTDDLDYHIRPMDTKHPIVLPVGHEAEFKVKKDRLFLKVPDGDRKMRQYQVVAMEPANHERENAAYHPDARQDRRWDSGSHAGSADKLPGSKANPNPVPPDSRQDNFDQNNQNNGASRVPPPQP